MEEHVKAKMIPDEIFNDMNEEVANKIAEDLDNSDVPEDRGDGSIREFDDRGDDDIREGNDNIVEEDFEAKVKGGDTICKGFNDDRKDNCPH